MRIRAASLGFALVLLVAARGATEEITDFETLRHRAKLLAARPYAARVTKLPPALMKLTYDEHRRLRFRPEESLWRRDALPFQAQFFHPGWMFGRTVQVHELRGRESAPVAYGPRMFDYDGLKLGALPADLGFAGFRLLFELNKPADELGAFLGASYFRFLCRGASYGLSARGLALDTGGPDAEEFPVFEEFWLERPAPGAKSLTVLALMDSPSVAGAYRFVITPGAETVTRVRAAVYSRRNARVFGVAPLTSMFWHGVNDRAAVDDFRPEVHDSDGLMLNTGAGEWLWRPLTNPGAVRAVAFADENPRGFGLVQRERRFALYEDLEANYHARPGAWVEPVGAWGRGAVRLVELPATDETADNIVAMWCPAALPPPGEPVEFDYKLHWFLDGIRPPAGYAAATRLGRSKTHEYELARFVVDFDGPYLGKQGPDPGIEPVVTVGAGATLASATVQKNPVNGTWRVAFALRPDSTRRPVELRCFLRKPPHVLTETWTYLWQP